MFRAHLTNCYFGHKDKWIWISYFFLPKYIKAKKEIVLTIAIRYQPDDELLEFSAIYSGDLSEDLIISEKINNEANKNIKSM